MRNIIILISFCILSLSILAQPTVNGTYPESGQIGSIIIIYGGAFDPVPANNIVRFGRIRTPVLAATSVTLKVKVPAGSTFHPVSVTINGRTATSPKPFRVIFGNDILIDSNAFAKRINFFWINPNANINGPFGLESIDVNDDGRNDLVTQIEAQFPFGSILKNLSVDGSINFDSPSFSFIEFGKNNLCVFDYDGDGLDDLGYTNNANKYASAYVARNQGSLAITHFSSASGFGISNSDLINTPVGSTAADFNLDKRIDFAAAFRGTNLVSVARNITSVPGTTQIGPTINLILPFTPTSIASGDLNNDSKPDLVVSVSNAYPSSVFVYLNTTLDSVITFAPPLEYDFFATEGSLALKIIDFDMDGKNDIVSLQNDRVSFRINTSTSGSFSLASPILLMTNPGNRAFDIGDLNGDLKPDLGIAGSQGYVQIFQNIGYLGGAAFNPPTFFTSSSNISGIVFADCNNDGLMDIAASNQGGPEAKTVSIFKNTLAAQMQLCSGDSRTLNSFITGTNYQWQIDSGVGFNNLSDNATYNGTNTSTLNIVAISNSSYGYKFRCIVDNIVGPEYWLKFNNTWTGAASSAWENTANWSCGSLPDQNTDVTISTGNVIISSNVTIRSLTVASGVTVTVQSGFTLTITK